MGLFDKIFKKAPKDKQEAPNLEGWLPIYGQFASNIFCYEVVQQAIKCIADEMKKLTPLHIRYKGNDPTPIRDSTVQAVLNRPNPLMTTTEFIEKVTSLLLLNYNAFIIPTYRKWVDEATGAERRHYDSLYPIQPAQVNFIQDGSGRLFVTFWFLNGEQTTIPYDDVIHLKWNYSINQYMGGNENGQPDQRALAESIELNRTLLSGVAKSMKASYAVNGVVKYNTMLDDGKMEKELRKLEQRLANQESGLMAIDLKSEFTPLEHKSEIIDEPTLKFVDEKILRFWGVPRSILVGDYSKEQYEAFYQKTLEPLIKSFSQAFTKKLFTDREQGFGNRIEFYPEDLIFMSISQKIEMVNLLAPTGAMFENEKRAVFGLMPLPELEGKRYMSLNWINAVNADQYQVGKENVDVVDEEKEDI